MNSNSPVFPSQTRGEDGEFNKGMNTRDYIAIEAMKGFCSYDNELSFEKTARLAYQQADALIAESKNK